DPPGQCHRRRPPGPYPPQPGRTHPDLDLFGNDRQQPDPQLGPVERAEQIAGPHQPTTTLTRRGGRAMTLRTVPSPIHSWIRSDANATRSASSAELSAGTSVRSRTLPLTWITRVATSRFTSSESHSGQASVASIVVWPVASHSSWARWGAMGDSSNNSNSVAASNVSRRAPALR